MFYKLASKTLASSFISLVLSIYSLSANANQQIDKHSINVLPNTCVTIHKGRKCFAKTNITWQTETVGQYCIAIKANVVHKKCWQNVREGKFIYEMASKENIEITLYSANEDIVLAETTIEVTWLYTGDSRKRRWRLF